MAGSIWRQFPRSFWAANGMEIFERMGWYGFYAVSSLYLTGSIEDGGLGFSDQDRGVIQGLAMFFLYLFPAVFGALADRFGYKKMFLASVVVMAPAYLLLAHPKTFWAFLAVYFLVAVGHGMFKPVVISTVAKAATKETGSMAFGIFYWMVNIGAFVGPTMAGIVRGWSWDYVFYASATWILVMGGTCVLLYQEPPRDAEKQSQRSLAEVFGGMVEVVGNLRFFLLVAGMLVILVMGSKWWSFGQAGVIALIWLAVNGGLDVVLRGSGRGDGDAWFLQPMRIGEGRYLLFLLLMAGFWVSFNQLGMTLPLYIRDYVDTTDLIATLQPVTNGIVGLAEGMGLNTSNWSQAALENGQVKPEYLSNNLNALGIICFQVLVAYLVRKVKPLVSIILGVTVTILSFLVYLIAPTGWIVVSAILVFSFGEMMSSPRSKEYAGLIAPPDKVGMYMGYFYWCVALGNLFGGLLSGVAYQHFGPQGTDRPGLMWIMFAALAGVTAVSLIAYDRWMTPRSDDQAASAG
jgi:POT family proton-dependent oligopeptide transporter